MKFFYALMVFGISLFMFFIMLVLAVPTPRLYVSETSIIQVSEETDIITQRALEIARLQNNNELYHFDESIPKKKLGALFVYSITTFITLFLITLAFFKRTYIAFPLYCAAIISFLFVSTLWLFTNFINKSLYLDVQELRSYFSGAKSILILIFPAAILSFLIGIGFLFKFPDSSKN